MVTYEERVEVFEQELGLIFDVKIKEFTKFCLMVAPDYFFTDCPASSSGKYHPIDELGADGTIIHTKKVFTVAYALSRALSCEEHRDEILAACIIHDICKQGMEKTGHTVKNHPELAAELVKKVQEDTQYLTQESYDIIYNSVFFHYGPWTVEKDRKELKLFTPEELCVYLSDYIASKREIDVKYKR